MTGGSAGAGDTAGTGTGGIGGETGDVMVKRAFFAMPVDEILAGCEANPSGSALDVITAAQDEAQ